MARMPLADEGAIPALAPTYQRIRETRGYVSNILASLGHAPEGLEIFARFGEYVRYRSVLPGRLREIAILALARGIRYAWAHHAPVAKREGVTQEELVALNEGRDPPTLSAAERAAAAFVRQFANVGRVDDAVYAEAARHLDGRALTDLTLTAGYFLALGSTINALQVDLEPNYPPFAP